MPTRPAALACAVALVGLAGCIRVPAAQPGVSIAIVSQNGYHPPPGAIPAPVSAQPGAYDYSGIARLTLDGRPVTPADVLSWMNTQNALVLGQITPLGDPIAGRLHIVLPDHDRLRLLALQQTRGVEGGAAEFGTEHERLDLHQVADAVIRAQVFAGADVVEVNDTVWPDAAGADDVLWYQVQSMRPNNVGPWIGSWQMRRANGAATLAVSFDPGTPPGPPRLLSFVRSVREVAGSLSGSPAGLAAGAAIGARRPGHPFSGGSGIVIDAHGHVLTDNHVIANCLDIRVTDAGGGTPRGATLIANDARLDLALLQTDGQWTGHARFRGSQSLRPGEPVVVTGFPLTGLVSPEMAVTTGSVTALSGGQGNDRLMQFSAPIQPGNSGGPVLDDSARVVGVATSELNGLALAALTGGPLPQNVNFATKADVARSYLAGIQVKLDESPGRPGLDPATVAEQAKLFTIKVECWR
jgi:S1-C subfamily serine protease